MCSNKLLHVRLMPESELAWFSSAGSLGEQNQGDEERGVLRSEAEPRPGPGPHRKRAWEQACWSGLVCLSVCLYLFYFSREASGCCEDQGHAHNVVTALLWKKHSKCIEAKAYQCTPIPVGWRFTHMCLPPYSRMPAPAKQAEQSQWSRTEVHFAEETCQLLTCPVPLISLSFSSWLWC